MPKLIPRRIILEYLEPRENKPVPKLRICSDLNMSPQTFKRKVGQLLDDDPDLCLLCCVYHKMVQKDNGNGKIITVSQFAGGYMIYNPQTATDETEEIIRDTYEWFLATGRAFTRLGVKMLNKKPLTELIPARQKKAIEKASKKYQEYLDNDYESVFAFGAKA